MNKANKKTHNLPKSSGQVSMLDFVLWFLVVLLLAGSVVATYYYQNLAAPLKHTGWIVVLLIVGGLISRTAKGKVILDFAKKARAELRKVVWPSRQETTQAATMVVVIVVVMALILWVIDSGLVWLASLATGQRG